MATTNTTLHALAMMIEKLGALAPLHPELFRQALNAYDEAVPQQWCEQCQKAHVGYYCTGEPSYFKEARAAVNKSA